MKKIIASLIAASLLLAGCVVVPVGVSDGPGASGFCPPGQAKKGNC